MFLSIIQPPHQRPYAYLPTSFYTATKSFQRPAASPLAQVSWETMTKTTQGKGLWMKRCSAFTTLPFAKPTDVLSLAIGDRLFNHTTVSPAHCHLFLFFIGTDSCLPAATTFQRFSGDLSQVRPFLCHFLIRVCLISIPIRNVPFNWSRCEHQTTALLHDS